LAIDPVAPAAPISPVRATGSSPELATALSALARAALANNTSTLGQIVGAAHAEAHTPTGAASSPVRDAGAAAADGEHLVAPSAPSAEPLAGDRLAAAVRSAAALAAPVQSGLAPIMADIEAAVIRPETPQAVRQAAKAVLESAMPTDRPMTSALVRNAVQGSGVFMEARLARAAVAEHVLIPSASGDMKAALLVFRAVVSTWLARTPGSEPAPARMPSASGGSAAAVRSGPQVGAVYTQSGSVSPSPGQSGALIDPQHRAVAEWNAEPGRPPVPDTLRAADLSTPVRPAIPRALAPSPPAPTIEQNLPTPALSAPGARIAAVPPAQPFLMVGMIEDEAVELSLPAEQDEANLARDPRSAGLAMAPRASSRPPPPYAGGPTSAQAAVLSDLPGDLPPAELARRLLKGVEGAIARQELSQIASLPEPRGEAERPTESKVSRWVFDLPFHTPHGVAVSQFEISRDGGGGGTDAGREIERTWRARFSLDVEPLGPVHVQIALTGACARVGLWAERPDAMARLQAGEAALSAALREAELSPEVAFHAGAPTMAAPAPGRFVDRAS